MKTSRRGFAVAFAGAAVPFSATAAQPGSGGGTYDGMMEASRTLATAAHGFLVRVFGAPADEQTTPDWTTRLLQGIGLVRGVELLYHQMTLLEGIVPPAYLAAWHAEMHVRANFMQTAVYYINQVVLDGSSALIGRSYADFLEAYDAFVTQYAAKPLS
ncbi:MAG: hypothetical protein M3Y45_08465 [Actinomycetota bacterium]|nr:hypothetical protein [Actinomycetota bacterium]